MSPWAGKASRRARSGECWAKVELDKALTIAIITRGNMANLLNFVECIDAFHQVPSNQHCGAKIWRSLMTELCYYMAEHAYTFSAARYRNDSFETEAKLEHLRASSGFHGSAT